MLNRHNNIYTENESEFNPGLKENTRFPLWGMLCKSDGRSIHRHYDLGFIYIFGDMHVSPSIVPVIILAIFIGMAAVSLAIVLMKFFMLLRTIFLLFTIFVLDISAVRTVIRTEIRIIWEKNEQENWLIGQSNFVMMMFGALNFV